MVKKVDLACGNAKREGFIGVDIAETASTDIVHNLLSFPWPFEDASVDEVHCSHFIEHIPHDVQGYDLDGLILFMNELYRILKPGGKATITAPYYSSIRAFGDPTHRRAICDWTFYYYNKEWRDANKLDHYGIIANFDAKLSYQITNEMTLKSEEVRNRAFRHDLNVIEDIQADLIKL